jgi:hypothetical protein
MPSLRRRIERLRKRATSGWVSFQRIDFVGYTQDGRPHVVLREGPEQVIVAEHFGHVGEPERTFIDRMWPDAICPNLGMA